MEGRKKMKHLFIGLNVIHPIFPLVCVDIQLPPWSTINGIEKDQSIYINSIPHLFYFILSKCS